MRSGPDARTGEQAMPQAGGGKRKRVAAIVTEYRFNAHADVILGRLLGDFDYAPQLEVVSIYTDQVPDNDMSRDMAARRGVPICGTIAEAIKLAHAEGGIDGVLIIGEHGDYPTNEKGQKMYPRCRLLRETLEALDELNVRVPIFSDKHLSYDLNEAKWMYNQLKRRAIPFLGGSSIPHTPPVPAYDPAQLETAREWLVVSFSTSIEAYGYHGLEVLQSLAERRSGGETGVSAVWALRGADVWAAMDRGEWPEALLKSALSVYPDVPAVHPRERDNDPVLFAAEYADGSRGYVIQFKDLVDQWGYAFRSDGGVTAARCDSEKKRPFGHFERLTRMIEAFVISGQPPFPMERVLMSTGLIGYGMEALYAHGRVDTPLLDIRYGQERDESVKAVDQGEPGGELPAPEQVLRRPPFSMAVRSGSSVYVSGQGGIDLTTSRIAGDDLATQFEVTMRNIADALAKAGLTTADIVRATVYLSDRSLYGPFNELYRSYFQPPYPARTVVYCELNYGLLVEIDVVATDESKTYY
ncbi:RidA family protein [Paenibacillus ginsengarvi]|nr:RidA family protein [Paenibacillus ginsengarvi]